MANYENIRPYAEFAKVAAKNGGVETYLNEIATSNYELGVVAGKGKDGLKALIAGFITLVFWEGGKWAYRKGKENLQKRKEATIKKSDEAKAAIIQGVKEAKEAGLIEEENPEDKCIIENVGGEVNE